MIFKNNLSIQGEFVFKIYDSGNNLLKIYSDKNFITNTGIAYLQNLALADCFRYLSIGSGLNQNSIQNGSDTTGLYSGISNFQYIGPNNNGYLTNGCGYRETCSGISLFKSWQVPNGGFFDNNYNFNEFILTPGCTGSFPPCNNEYYGFLNQYPNICTYTKAFTRITGSISVGINNYMIVSYTLNVNTNTGINYFNILVNNAGHVGSNSNWSSLTGYYNLVHHGLKLINPGGLNIGNVPQPLSYTNSICDSINAPLGSPIEPSTSSSQIVLYLTTDDTQFLVSPYSGGGMNTGLYFPYNSNGLSFPSGTEYFQCYPTTSYLNNGNEVPYWLENIRQGSLNNIYPSNSNYTNSISNNSVLWLPAGIGFDVPNSKTISYSSNKRTGVASISVQFAAVQSALNNFLSIPIRGMVFAYTGNLNQGNLYPFLDVVFKGTDGNFPLIYTGINQLYFSDSNNYNILDDQNNLSFNFSETWTSPCPSNVLGC